MDPSQTCRGNPTASPPPRAVVLVLLRLELRAQGVNVGTLDSHRGARRTVTVMFGQVKKTSIPRHLKVEGHSRLEAMLPVDGESEVLDVELLGLRLVKNAQNRRGATECHNSPSGSEHSS